MRGQSGRSGVAGFTAVEVLLGLSILALIGAIAMVAFRRHVVSARSTEATGMLMELAEKEQAFRGKTGHYLPLRADGRSDLPSADEDPEAFYPLAADSPKLASARQSTRMEDRTLWPPAWRSVALRPKSDLAHCTYLVNAGDKGRPDGGMRYGAQLLATDVAGPWFYALAACNLSGPARGPAAVTIYGISSENFAVRTFNAGQ
jgi:Tfp pilus assembly protein PilE